MSWLTEGPMSGLFNHGDTGPRSTGSYALQGARAGAALGPVGIAAGALSGWLYGRAQQSGATQGYDSTQQRQDYQNNATANQIAGVDIGDMSRNQAQSVQPELDAAVNWDPNSLDAEGEQPHDHQARIEARDNGTLPQLHGVSNFIVGGFPVINGVRTTDMNSLVYKNRNTPGN